MKRSELVSSLLKMLGASASVILLGIGISLLSELLPNSMSEYVAAFHLIGSAFMHMGGALVFWSVTDHSLFYWFDIREAIQGTGLFEGVNYQIRAASILGYFIAFAAVFRGLSMAGV